MKTANYQTYSGDLEPVSIARRKSPYAGPMREYKLLAPTYAMMQLSDAAYGVAFRKYLATLDAAQVYEELGEDTILLCWERYGLPCHRRLVAEWLEEKLGVEVTENGHPRDAVRSYDESVAYKKAQGSLAI